MTGQEKGDILMQVTAYTGLTVGAKFKIWPKYNNHCISKYRD
jgi:hypothetical protein